MLHDYDCITYAGIKIHSIWHIGTLNLGVILENTGLIDKQDESGCILYVYSICVRRGIIVPSVAFLPGSGSRDWSVLRFFTMYR